MAKPFMPRVGQPGARIAWTHYRRDGSNFDRAGEIWSPAPIGKHMSNAWWVVPDDPQPTDLYDAVYVGQARGNHVPAHGTRRGRWWEYKYVSNGIRFGSDCPGSLAGRPTAEAWLKAHELEVA